MPFIPIHNIAKYQNYKDSPKIAKVINNNDPKMLGRIKVELPGMYEPEDEVGSNLPWIRRIQDNFLCGSGEMFSVPDIGSFVAIVWPYDNNSAFYTGIPYGVPHKTDLFTQDYPNEWGWTDGKFTFKINKKTNQINISTLKANVQIDPEGNVIINSGNITITGGNISVTGGDMNVEGGNMNVTGADMKVSGSSVNISGNTTIDGKVFLSHQHSNGNNGGNTGGVV